MHSILIYKKVFKNSLKFSGIISKISFHLDPSRIETLCGTINNWKSFIENLTSMGDSHSLCEIRIQYIDLVLSMRFACSFFPGILFQ